MVGEVGGQPERQRHQAGSLLLLGLRSFSLLVHARPVSAETLSSSPTMVLVLNANTKKKRMSLASTRPSQCC